MTERPHSKTAFGVAILRAAHQLLDGPPRILDDVVVVPLLGPGTAQYVNEHSARLRDPRAMALRTHVLLRSRYAEERLHAAVERGVSQLIILGAGLDTFAYRQPEWAAKLRIFEVDHPASQQTKRDHLERGHIPIPPNLTFVSVDFEHETLSDRLVAHDFDFTAPAFVSCLGVLVYLTMDAVTDLFRFIAILAPGSECVLTFGGYGGAAGSGVSALAERAAAVGEPFQSPLDTDELNALCTTVGLPAPILPTASEIASYLGDRHDGLRPPGRESIASITVAAPSA